jgi:bacteriocin-like protein
MKKLNYEEMNSVKGGGPAMAASLGTFLVFGAIIAVSLLPLFLDLKKQGKCC